MSNSTEPQPVLPYAHDLVNKFAKHVNDTYYSEVHNFLKNYDEEKDVELFETNYTKKQRELQNELEGIDNNIEKYKELVFCFEDCEEDGGAIPDGNEYDGEDDEEVDDAIEDDEEDGGAIEYIKYNVNESQDHIEFVNKILSQNLAIIRDEDTIDPKKFHLGKVGRFKDSIFDLNGPFCRHENITKHMIIGPSM
jgi:hypothetical protein